MKRGKTYIISGPSGVGKSTVLHALLEEYPDLYFSVSATTRAPREGERDGVDYHFATYEQFQQMIADDAFLEHAEYVGNCYGTPKKYVDEAMEQGRNVILDIDVQGAEQVCTRRPETVRIFVVPPSWEELERRLTTRGTDSPEKIQKRLQRAKEELKLAGRYDYFVMNDSVEHAVAQVKAIFEAEDCRSRERIANLLEA